MGYNHDLLRLCQDVVATHPIEVGPWCLRGRVLPRMCIPSIMLVSAIQPAEEECSLLSYRIHVVRVLRYPCLWLHQHEWPRRSWHTIWSTLRHCRRSAHYCWNPAWNRWVSILMRILSWNRKTFTNADPLVLDGDGFSSCKASSRSLWAVSVLS